MVPFEFHIHRDSGKLAAINAQLKVSAEGSGKTPDITFSIDATGVGEGVAKIIESKTPLAEIYRVYLAGG